MGLLNNDRVQVQFRGTCFGQQIILNRMYLISGDFPLGTSVNTDLQSILTSVIAGGVNDQTTPYLACLPATYTLNECRAQRIKPTRSAYSSQFPIGFVGTNANAATKPNCTGSITFRTALGGRGQHGTAHIGPAPDAAAVAGILTAAYQTLLGNLGTPLLGSFVPPLSGSLVVPILWQRKTDTFQLWQSFFIGQTSRVQRRRTVGIGK